MNRLLQFLWSLPIAWRKTNAGRFQARRSRTGRLREHWIGAEVLEDRTLLAGEPLFPGPQLDAGNAPNSVGVADVNNDGVIDVITSSKTSFLNYPTAYHGVSVLLGNGDGTFQPAQTPFFETSVGPNSVAVGDLDGDGAIDIATANEDATVGVLFGNGDGTFQSRQFFAVGGAARFVTVGDFNGDNVDDLATANSLDDTVSVLLSNGDRTFQAAQDFAVGDDPLSVRVADFNGDGKLDLATPNSNSDNVSVLLGNGDGTFQAATSFFVGDRPTSIVTGDYDDDGVTDFVVDILVPGTSAVRTYLGNGDGTFSLFALISEVSGVRTVGDFDDDGIKDVATFGGSVLFGIGDGRFQAVQTFTLGEAAADFDGDGVDDLVGRGGSRAVTVYINNVDRTFQAAETFNAGIIGSITTADFNGDGVPDLMGAANGGFTVLLSDGFGSFLSPQFNNVGSGGAVTTADFNRDGITDIAQGGSSISIFLGNGDGTFQPKQSFAASGGRITTGDFNADGIIDLATLDGWVLIGNGDATFQTAQNFDPGGTNRASIIAADVNGDGASDVVTSTLPPFGQNGGFVSVILGNGDGTFQPRQDFGMGNNPESVTAADFDGDGVVDLATSAYLSDTAVVRLGNGDGTFQPAQSFLVDIQPHSIAATDFDGDSVIDLVTGNNVGNVSVLLGNGDGTFQPRQDFAGSGTQEVTTADFNGDGRIDIVTEGSILLNRSEAPVISGIVARQFVDDNQTMMPFSHVGIHDDQSALSITITLNDAANGTLSGGGFTDLGGGVYRITGVSPVDTQNAIRSLTFDPTENQVRAGDRVTTRFTVVVANGLGTSTNSQTTVIATSFDDPPIANDDPQIPGDPNYATDRNTVLSVDAAHGVLVNDFDPDVGESVEFVSNTNSANGAMVVVDSDGSFTYDPSTLNPGNYSSDTFTYEIRNVGVTPGADFAVDAGLDTDGDDRWQDQVGTTGFELLLDDSPAVTRMTGVSAFPGITAAYDFSGGLLGNEAGALLVDAGTTTAQTFQNAPGNWSNQNVTFEIWFKPDNLTPTVPNGQILFEDGGGTGIGFYIDDNLLRFRKQPNAGDIAFDLSGIGDEFIQAVGTYDVLTGVMNLYVDGVFVGTDTAAGGDWTGGDPAAIGTLGGANSGGIGSGQQATQSFDGQIAIFRVYSDQILNDAQVYNNYKAVTGSAQNVTGTVTIALTGAEIPETIVVTNTNDSGVGSLRQAILDSNTSPDLNTIVFNIPGAGSHSIDLLSALPNITDTVVIDGWSQPGFAGTPMIELNGAAAGAGANGLVLAPGSDGTTIRGLVINLFGGNGIEINGSSSNVIAGNYIGTDATGTVGSGNSNSGVFILGGATDNIIGTNGDGTEDLSERNIISGNAFVGVQIVGAGTVGNTLAGNYIGTDITGSASVPNGRPTSGIGGVWIWSGASQNIIGTDGDGVSDDLEGNLISGNERYAGVFIENVGTDVNVVAGNLIGTDATGTLALANSGQGIVIKAGARMTRVGTDGDGVSDSDERNVISGNDVTGVYIWGSGTTQSVVAGNYIGTDVTGTIALGNGGNGVLINLSASNNVIGTDGDGMNDASEGNVISGNLSVGVNITGAGTDSNVVAGNYIGTDVSGTLVLGNSLDGVIISQGAQFNRIGTDGSNDAYNANERNIISGNDRFGVQILNSGTSNNVVAGNYIGTDVSGSLPVGNAVHGVVITNGASANIIGTNGDGMGDAVEGNVISANLVVGVNITQAGTDDNVVAGNLIGTNAAGTSALGNGNTGVTVSGGAKNNRIGTNSDGVSDDLERNIISGTTDSHGVAIRDAGTEGNVVAGNYVGTDINGTAALGNGAVGIAVYAAAANNLIGGVLPAARNVISGNGSEGVRIVQAGTNGNRVQGNYIGTDWTGTAALGNLTQGVNIYATASGNIIGTDGDGVNDASEGNVISGNQSNGVNISGVGTQYNIVAGNWIGTDHTGSFALGNTFNGVQMAGGASNNWVGTNGDDHGDANEGNLISGNQGSGVNITQAGTDWNVIAGNLIGTNADGSLPLGNAATGVEIHVGASQNFVGTDGNGVSDDLERNVISGNLLGVQIRDAGSDSNVVAGNTIGTNAKGTASLGTQVRGVDLFFDAQFNVVGTNGDGIGDEAEGNLISGNQARGVHIVESHHNTVAGNVIGLDATGKTAIDFGGIGIQIQGGTANWIGTNADGTSDTVERNIISGNTDDGIRLTTALDNTIAGNYIGTDITGTVPVGNANDGLRLHLGSTVNQIGGSVPAARNVISANGANGILISDAGTTGNLVIGNFIGTDERDLFALGNAGSGVRIQSGASSNFIGTDGDGTNDPAEGNTIAYNLLDGVTYFDGGATIRGNSIYSNAGLGIDYLDDGVTANGAGLQDFPVFFGVQGGASTRVLGSISGPANSTLMLDFYANGELDPSGFGEGRRYLGSTSVTTNSVGVAAFDVSLSVYTVAGESVTATATPPDGSTSEFSLDQAATFSQPPTILPDSLIVTIPESENDNAASPEATFGVVTFNVPENAEFRLDGLFEAPDPNCAAHGVRLLGRRHERYPNRCRRRVGILVRSCLCRRFSHRHPVRSDRGNGRRDG